jgi:hypothetical protein
MTQISVKVQAYDELRGIILTSPREQLLPKLKDKFRNAAVEDRGMYKNELLKLAQDPDIEPFHSPIFETLASLNSIWVEHLPGRGLIQEFNQLYKAGKYEDAARICSYLISQGLDYLDTIDIGEGTILPIYDKKEPGILQFNEQEMKFLDLELNLVRPVDMPQGQRIIDVLSPANNGHYGIKDSVFDNIIWVLLEDIKSLDRLIIPLTNDRKKLDMKAKIAIPKKYAGFNCISRFQGHLLLVGPQSILYYRSKQGWEQWLTIEDKITCFKQTEDKYWIGSADGHIRIIHSFDQPGRRGSIERFPTSITSISVHEKFAVAASEKELIVTTLGGISTMGPIRNDVSINQVLILNNEIIVILQNNSRLLGRDIHNGDILWQINLEDRYDSLLNIGNRVYCKKTKGDTRLFVLPDIQEMTQSLKKHKITISEVSPEKDPTAPVHDRIDAYGRGNILEEIKKNLQAFFFISGPPKSGKTSLLYTLNDVLAANSRCCYIDIEQINRKSSDHDEFEENFYTQCLSQHGIPLENLSKLSIFLKLTNIVKKVRGNKDYCAFFLDNFIPPEFNDDSENEKFNQLFKEMSIRNDIRLIMTCRKSKQKENEQYLKNIRFYMLIDKEIRHIELPILSEEEAKIAIRKIEFLNDKQVEEVYHYTGGFPHLIQLYQEWNPEEVSIEAYSEMIAREYKKTIFAYFGDLSPNARLIMAALIYRDLFSKKLAFEKIYKDYPLLSEFIARDNFKNILKEINNYSSEFKAEYDEDRFKVDIEGNPRLFYMASHHIPWIEALFALFQFCANPGNENAHQVILAIRDLLNLKIEDVEKLDDPTYNRLKDQFKDQFYIREMGTEARYALKIPLMTYIVILLKPWVKAKTIQYFTSLHNLLQEYIRRSRKYSVKEGAAAKFYILLFNFSRISFEDLQNELIGLERISIIDIWKMRDIMLAENPLEKNREIIFLQMKISERSPYIYAGPVEELFYGRDIEIALVRGLPENIGIFGTRTIGKTSLMLKVYRDLKDRENWRVFALDCGRIDSEKKLLKTLAEKMDIPFRIISNIRKFKKFITRRAEQDGVKYIFLLDEVDSLIAYDVKHGEKIFKTFNILRTEPLKSEDTAARFALLGFEEMFKQMKNPTSRLYNFMVFLPLQALDTMSAFALVTHPMKNIYVKWQNEEDARYLVEQCSAHPWLLQAACHTLLKILELKADKFDIVERENVNQALVSDDFRQLCLRPYESISGLIKEPFFKGIHKITTLAALVIHLEKSKELFSLNEIREELKSYGVNMAPDQMHTIITRLCMYGILKYLGDPDIIMKEKKDREEELKEGIEKLSEDVVVKPGEISIKQPEIFDITKGYTLALKYQFAVKIFPRILAANLDGLENCKIEIEETVKRKK